MKKGILWVIIPALLTLPTPRSEAGAAAAIRVVVQRKELTSCVQSGGACVKESRAVPYMADGKAVGWKLLQVRKGSLLERLKLKDGDVILSANGEALNDLTRLPYWMFQIVTVKSVDLGILRGGKPMHIDYQVKD